jgi:DNA-binding NarL/FixJ family response regulator
MSFLRPDPMSVTRLVDQIFPTVPLDLESSSSFDRHAESSIFSRLVARPYVDEVRFTEGLEYSVQIQHAGSSFYFPLGSSDRHEAALKADQILRTVRNEGWTDANDRFAREITVGVFWTASPLTCSYSTIYSVPGEIPRRWKSYRQSAHGTCRTVIVQEEQSVQRAMAFWINRQPGFRCVAELSSVEEALDALVAHRGHLLIVDRQLLRGPDGAQLNSIRRLWPQVNVFTFGIYEESNYIFHSVTGVKSGYLLCRRPPARWFEPVRSLAIHPEMRPAKLQDEIQDYFRMLFGEDHAGRPDGSCASLTAREHDVLLVLAKGSSEKEVATALRISSQTVHNHVKNIYAKLNVHSRTEALMRYLGR